MTAVAWVLAALTIAALTAVALDDARAWRRIRDMWHSGRLPSPEPADTEALHRLLSDPGRVLILLAPGVIGWTCGCTWFRWGHPAYQPCDGHELCAQLEQDFELREAQP